MGGEARWARSWLRYDLEIVEMDSSVHANLVIRLCELSG